MGRLLGIRIKKRGKMKKICHNCFYHEIDEGRTEDDYFLFCYCSKWHYKTHDECDCNTYDSESGNPIECEDFTPYT